MFKDTYLVNFPIRVRLRNNVLINELKETHVFLRRVVKVFKNALREDQIHIVIFELEKLNKCGVASDQVVDIMDSSFCSAEYCNTLLQRFKNSRVEVVRRPYCLRTTGD